MYLLTMLWIIGSLFAAVVANSRDRNPVAWFLIALVLTPVTALIALAIIPDPIVAMERHEQLVDAIADHGPDPLLNLERLADLRDRGVITPADYEAKKAELLARL